MQGKAVVTLRMEPRYGRVYKDATVLLRPKTGLKDMVAELEPGHPSAGRLKDGGVIPVSQTLPDVNLDEILAALDTDTRDYLTVLLGAGAEGLRGNGRELANALRRIEPSARYGRKVFASLAERRKNIKRVIHNLSLVMDELGAKDDQLAEFVENSNAVFADARAPGREPALDAVRAAVVAQRDPARPRQGEDAGRRARPDAAGAAARRARPRPVAASRCARS